MTHFKPSPIRSGDVSSWARATTHFQRPDDMSLRRKKQQINKVKNLDSIVKFHERMGEAKKLPDTSAEGFCVPIHTPAP